MAGFAYRVGIGNHKSVKTHFERKLGQETTINDTGSKLSEEPFVFEGETVIEIFGHNCAKDGIAQIFKPFIVHGIAHFINVGG